MNTTQATTVISGYTFPADAVGVGADWIDRFGFADVQVEDVDGVWHMVQDWGNGNLICN